MRFRKKNKSLSRLNSKKIIKLAVLPLIYIKPKLQNGCRAYCKMKTALLCFTVAHI